MFSRHPFRSRAVAWTTGPESRTKPIAQLRTAAVGERVNLLKQLQSNPSVKLIDAIDAMNGCDPVQKNLLLGVAQSIWDRTPNRADSELLAIVNNRQLDAAARYWAFTTLTDGDREERNNLLRSMLDDPALELRYEAVKLAQEEIKALKDSGKDAGELKTAYKKLLASARLPEQVQQIADSLKELGETVNLLEHFGFVSQWQLIASFDNREKIGFNIAYEPEKLYLAQKNHRPQSRIPR